jgi:hypothetical protein
MPIAPRIGPMVLAPGHKGASPEERCLCYHVATGARSIAESIQNPQISGGTRGDRQGLPVFFPSRFRRKRDPLFSHPRIPKPKVSLKLGIGSQPVVTWGAKEKSYAGRSVATSSCHRARPRAWFSLKINEDRRRWLKPRLTP